MACRDLKRAQDAADDIRRKTSGTEGAGEVLTVHLDLSSLDSVRECAQTLLRTEKYINILINNAGKSHDDSGLIPDKISKTSIPSIMPRTTMLPT